MTEIDKIGSDNRFDSDYIATIVLVAFSGDVGETRTGHKATKLTKGGSEAEEWRYSARDEQCLARI